MPYFIIKRSFKLNVSEYLGGKGWDRNIFSLFH